MPRALFVVLLTAVACTPKQEPATTPQRVAFTATDFAFAGPDTIAPGMTEIQLVNHGSQEHHLIVGRLDDGKSMTDLMTEMGASATSQPSWFKLVGSAGAIMPGDSAGSVENLAPGHYLAICFLPDPADGKAHVEKGMMKEFVVAGTPVVATAPTADIELKLMEFAYEVPAITEGVHTFHVSNAGVQYHEAQLIKLDDGKTLQDFMAAMAPGAKGPPPGKGMGGSGALSGGMDNYWTVNLTPGNYAFLCMVPDSAGGTPHMMKGMVKEFAVTGK